MFKTLFTSTSILLWLSLFYLIYMAVWNRSGLLDWFSWCLKVHFECWHWVLIIYFVFFSLILFASIFTTQLVTSFNILIHWVHFRVGFFLFVSIIKLRWVNLMNLHGDLFILFFVYFINLIITVFSRNMIYIYFHFISCLF